VLLIGGALNLVSVGMPVFNSEATLTQSVESVLNQSHKNLELVISDNHSSDRTEEICRRYAESDSRVRYFRQPQSIGPTKNFQFVLDFAQGDFFTWHAGDDFMSTDFIQSNYENLVNRPELIASTSTHAFGKSIGSKPRYLDFDLTGSLIRRIDKFFIHAEESHSLFYSLIRTEAIRKCYFISELFFGWDWAIILFLTQMGEIGRTDRGFKIFSPGGVSQQGRKNVYKFHGVKGIKRLMPFFDFGRILLSFGSSRNIKKIFLLHTLRLTVKTLGYEGVMFRQAIKIRLKKFLKLIALNR
jgi:glycosyltransferase involved in cell wall biosynthesis